MVSLVRPHGGTSLRPLMPEGEALAAARARADRLTRVVVSSREAGDIVMLGIGGFTPLAGFMGEADWRGVCDEMRTADGLFWPIPITLSVDADTASGIAQGDGIALLGPGDSTPMAILEVSEKYTIDKARECRSVFRTTDAEHPGVKMVMEQGDVNLAGRLTVLSAGGFPDEFGELFLTPAETRARFEANGWNTVAAFQTRNPMHRSHEYLAKIAIEICDGVLIHLLLGNLKPGDVPASVRAGAIDTLIANYFVANTVMHAGYPLDMRYAGPRERCCTRCFARTTVARTCSSGATTRGSGITTGRSTHTTYSTKSMPMRWRRSPSGSTGPSGAPAAGRWRRCAPARTTPRTDCCFRGRSCARCSPRATRCRTPSVAPRSSPSCASTTRACRRKRT